jgi:hypothetical protein
MFAEHGLDAGESSKPGVPDGEGSRWTDRAHAAEPGHVLQGDSSGLDSRIDRHGGRTLPDHPLDERFRARRSE